VRQHAAAQQDCDLLHDLDARVPRLHSHKQTFGIVTGGR
jgi:hypothetical protein